GGETRGGRDYGRDEARKYARRFGVTPEWLLTGREPFPEGDEPPPPKIPVVGYVGAGATPHFYDVPQAHLDEITPPGGLAENTAAGEIRGDSLGPFFKPWDGFYDDRRPPVTPGLIRPPCVVGLPAGRILIKQIQRGASEGLYSLYSATEKPIPDVPVEWAARVNVISRGADRE